MMVGSWSLLILCPIEAELFMIRNMPSIAAMPALSGLARSLYGQDRNLVQYMPGATRFDLQLGYIFEPDVQFVFRNTEFSTPVSTNSLGLRDTEKSLQSPEIIVLGDSFAMGWGVDDTESFPSVLEELTGHRVLNGGISSYGTARELRLLERLDLSGLRYLVIQYCDNDYEENLAFRKAGNQLQTMTSEAFDDTVFWHARKKEYYPFQLFWRTLSLDQRISGLINGFLPSPRYLEQQSLEEERFAQDSQHVDEFLNVLTHSSIDLNGVQLIVMELNSSNHRDDFLSILQARIAESRFPEYVRSMQIVDVAADLPAESWFLLDDHLNAGGHRRVAEKLVEQLRLVN